MIGSSSYALNDLLLRVNGVTMVGMACGDVG